MQASIPPHLSDAIRHRITQTASSADEPAARAAALLLFLNEVDAMADRARRSEVVHNLPVAPITLPLRSLPFGVLPAIRSQGAAHVVALFEAALLVAAHVAFVRAVLISSRLLDFFGIEASSRAECNRCARE